jgi:CelD/BcsL family acetyltransferase involved in cellulose biosynthesis
MIGFFDRRFGILLTSSRSSDRRVGNGKDPAEMASDQNLTIVVHESMESLEPLRPEWDRLLREYSPSTIFSTYEWLVPWWWAFAGADQLLVLAFRDPSSSLVGLAPLAVTVRRSIPLPVRVLRLMGDGTHDSDNLDLPVRPGYEDRFIRDLFDWMHQNSGRWDICELNTLPCDSSVGEKLRNELARRKWPNVASTRPQTIVELEESWEAYLKKLSSKERGKIGLRTRRLEKKFEVRMRRCSKEAEIDSMLLALFDLHGKHWRARGLPGTLQSAARQKFYGELARFVLARDRLEFWVLELDGKIVAAQFGLRYGTAVFSLQEGFDPAHAVDSVGYVLRSHVLKQVMSDGVRRYDFLGGTDDSKMRWGGELREYLNLHFARPGSRGSVYLSLKSKIRETKTWLRNHLPAGVWKGLKSTMEKGG